MIVVGATFLLTIFVIGLLVVSGCGKENKSPIITTPEEAFYEIMYTIYTGDVDKAWEMTAQQDKETWSKEDMIKAFGLFPNVDEEITRDTIKDDFKILDTEEENGKAILTVYGDAAKCSFTFTLIQENGEWKALSE